MVPAVPRGYVIPYGTFARLLGHQVPTQQHAGQPAADDGAQDTEDDVADDPVATTPHQRTREPAGNETQNNPSDDSHWTRTSSSSAATKQMACHPPSYGSFPHN